MTAVSPGTSAPDRDRLDADLAAAEDAVVRASASLVELEAHPGHGLLAPGGFTGISARRREETLATVAELHRDLALYRRAVATAREARGTRSRPSTEELTAADAALHGETVVVAEEAVPLQRRGLLGPTSRVTRTSADALLARMTAGFDAATEVVAAVAAVWDDVAAALGPVERALEDLWAEPAMDGVAADLRRWADRLAALRTAALTDPLARSGDTSAVDPAAVAEIEAGVAAVGDALAEARALRAGLDDRVAALTAAVDELAGAEAAAAAVAAETARLVVGPPGLPVPDRRAPALRTALREAHDDARRGAWAAASTGFTAVSAGVRAARAAATSDHAVLAGLLDRRAELRGRLGALRAKAAARGRSEDLALDALHTRARDLLWTAPCDLAASTVAVRAYQRALEDGAAS
ncbi:hypothetical protein [Actinomycetospora sp. NBRC 106378]|uniref:hypothetical protein n=1 Tax=Actinomycetospora sp. NBRC 106378 TaxID=3032208 RepID=UPI0024A4CF54|nr:hypothetical protein [Actinomycetospora sp. NBRC 106378]GLZ52030.1 hypothetical protein Acsp07_16470 [Actinomycetospora sp. NBRC 106378]